jgi:hypothetical protein
MGRDRFAQQLLSWEWRGVQLEAAIPRCTYFCRTHGREVIAWCELRDISGGRRVEIGSFPSVAAAKAACELHAAAWCRRDREEHGPVSVAIGRKRRAVKADKGRELPAQKSACGCGHARRCAGGGVLGDRGRGLACPNAA